MKKYYINRAYIPEGELFHYRKFIALFTNNNWSGKGNFNGWYSDEYYNDTNMIAFYEIEENDGINTPISEIKKTNIYFKQIRIYSCYAETVIMAETDDEAIKKFEEWCCERRA